MEIKRTISLTADSKVGDVTAMRHTATINSENPEDITISHIVIKKDEYRDNRAEIAKDYAEFEDVAYEVQSELLTTESKTEEA